jgi:hypothetical protein
MKPQGTWQHDPAHFVAVTSWLSTDQIMNAIPLADVLRALNEHAINFVLVGAHGLAEWRKESRATEDVDIVVMARHQKKAVRALLGSFPQLEADDQEVVTRLGEKETKRVRIGVMKTNQPLYTATFKNIKRITIGNETCKIPSLEMALAMKFAAMISLNRADYKKYMDAGDFIRVLNVNPDIDLAKLAELGDLVYPGGGKEIVEKVHQVRAGQKLVL